MIPVIAIVGRPNVGKSTLFNCLTHSRDALVYDKPGVTRDRQYGEGFYEEHRFIVIDTGGLGEATDEVDDLMASQAKQAMEEASFILFLVDARQGVMPGDFSIAKELRSTQKPLCLVLNKTDGLDPLLAKSDFYSLGLGEPITIAASHQRGIHTVLEHVFSHLPLAVTEEETLPSTSSGEGIHIAVVGRPNVGKSTLVNRLLGEERVIAFDEPGTTRSSIYISYEHLGQPYTLIDTAGVRRRSKVKDVVEKFSIIKTLQAIEAADVVILLMDAQDDVVDQELRLLDFILEAGKGAVIAVNKWDGLSQERREEIREALATKLHFVDFLRIHFISARHGSGVGNLYDSIHEAYESATKTLTSSALTKVLEEAVARHQPPLVHGRRIKLRFAHPSGIQPPSITIHGNQTTELPKAYQRYLIHAFRKAFRLMGTPIRLVLKTGENPYHKGSR